MNLSKEFDRIQAASLDVLQQDTRLPLYLNTALREILENAFLPNIERGLILNRVVTPKEYRDSGRVALLPIKRYGEVCVDPGDTIYNTAPLPEQRAAVSELRAEKIRKSTVDSPVAGQTAIGAVMLEGVAYEGSALLMIRRLGRSGQVAATAIHEATHAHLWQGSPNLATRLQNPSARHMLASLDEAECYRVNATLAPLTGQDMQEISERNKYYLQQAQQTAAPLLDLSNFYYMRAFPQTRADATAQLL